MAKGVKVAVVGTVFAVMVGGAGYGAYNLLSAVDGGSSAKGPAPVKTGPPSSGEVKDTATAFFAAWEKGEASVAAGLTNNAGVAGPLFTAYGTEAHIGGVKITPGTITGATVPYRVDATVSYGSLAKPISYSTSLTVVRGVTTGKALVDWKPAVVHPALTSGTDTLVTGDSGAPAIEAVDRDGKVLTAEKYPSLGATLDALRKKYGAEAGGTPGVELVVKHAQADQPDKTLVTLAEGKAGKVRTTLSASVQAAAETAVKRYPESSVVAIQPSSGDILAIANNTANGFNSAVSGARPPGSTMKIVTAATLIDNKLTTANGPAPCTDTALWEGQTFHNITNMKPDESATLASSFARSCNTAFIKYTDDLADDSLTKEAQERFGIGRGDWKIGIASVDGEVPAVSGPDKAANLIGQGQVQLNPLNMASITATAKTGTFRQPVLVPLSFDQRTLATAQGLSSATSQQLRTMMRRTAVSGTAANVMAGLGGGNIGAKTGSAETDGNATSDSWFTAYRNDVAAAAMVQSGGHGVDAAGPIVVSVLKAG
ncbi:penicillin-binding transpeptidase domain-containing protein [Streptomyces acidiscabies]|uniref:penicillin-binding transpeptidase domain-containing protein n=1 Tax=Streptomyces acidiscabies TaxID=42234 RepID=UPI0009630DD4|nr:penicillin-binding transpeptidase domain-containing protein [Streptomyces acidiscabies]GAV45162.1 penicillin-binding protein A [Streptomyces acidiscabies]